MKRFKRTYAIIALLLGCVALAGGITNPLLVGILGIIWGHVWMMWIWPLATKES